MCSEDFINEGHEGSRRKRNTVALLRALRGHLFFLCVMFSAPSVWAQCAMCRVSIANSDDPGRVGGTLNVAILVLLIPTLVLIGAFVSLVLRYYRADRDSDA